MLCCLFSCSTGRVYLCRERTPMVRHARLVPSAHNKCSTGAWNEHGKHVGEGREQGRKRAGTRRQAGPLVGGDKARRLPCSQKLGGFPECRATRDLLVPCERVILFVTRGTNPL